jgi:hypothetical protein
VLKLFDAYLRALGVTPKIKHDWLGRARETYGTPHEPGGLTAVRAMLAVLDGNCTLDDIKRGFKQPLAKEAK